MLPVPYDGRQAAYYSFGRRWQTPGPLRRHPHEGYARLLW
jgi:hypothetical protein